MQGLKKWWVIEMYESPITIIQKQLDTYVENEVLKVAQGISVYVDKEELTKALKYDRDQYNKGYEDGIASTQKQAHWEIDCDGYYPYCSNCRHEPEGRTMTKYCENCGARMVVI